MDYFALLLPILIIIIMLAGLVILKRRLFSDDDTPAPIPLPTDLVQQAAEPQRAPTDAAPVPAPSPAPSPAQGPVNGPVNSQENGQFSLSPARLYPRRPLNDTQKSVFSRLLKALPGYVVLPKITYDHFLEARDGSASENTSLQNRAAQHLADFIICDKKLRVLLVCQIDDGTQLPARLQERDKMLQKSGLRLLRWKVAEPPDPQALLNAVQKLDAMNNTAN